jgi:cyclohexadienyl dehydratase
MSPEETQRTKMTIDDSGPSQAPTGDSASEEPAFVRIQTSGKLRVGVATNTTPFTYKNTAGEIVGFDIAFAYELARTLDVELVLVPFTYDTWRDELMAGRFDIATSGL